MESKKLENSPEKYETLINKMENEKFENSEKYENLMNEMENDKLENSDKYENLMNEMENDKLENSEKYENLMNEIENDKLENSDKYENLMNEMENDKLENSEKYENLINEMENEKLENLPEKNINLMNKMENKKLEVPPERRHLPFNCRCKNLYTMTFYNYKIEKEFTFKIHVVKKEEVIYKSLNDIVKILNEALDMKITVRTLTQGTGHYVLQKDRVIDFLPCCKSTKYRGTIFVNIIGFRDTLVKYLNTSNATIQTRSNATMRNIIKVKINSNTIIQMLENIDTVFEITKGITLDDIPINKYVRTHKKHLYLKMKENNDKDMKNQFDDINAFINNNIFNNNFDYSQIFNINPNFSFNYNINSLFNNNDNIEHYINDKKRTRNEIETSNDDKFNKKKIFKYETSLCSELSTLNFGNDPFNYSELNNFNQFNNSEIPTRNKRSFSI